MIDIRLDATRDSGGRFLDRFDGDVGRVPTPELYRQLGELILAAQGLSEELLHELCMWPDPRLIRFLEGARVSGVPEAIELTEAILQRRGLSGLEPWLDRLLREDEPTRWLVDVFADVKDDVSTRLLLGLLDHPRNAVRRRASDGLASHRGSFDGRALVRNLAEPLVRSLSHPDPLAAVRALHRIADPVLEPDFGRETARRAERVLINCVVHERRSPVRGDAIAALGDLGSRAAVRCLVDMLHREDESFHQDVVIALRKIRPDRALIALLGLLQSRDPIIREEAANALGEIGDRQAVRRLRDLLDDEEADVRQEAVLALGKLGGREVLDALERALADSDPAVRISACSALASSLGQRAEGKLISALHDGSPDVRAEAAHLLGEIGETEAERHLRLYLDDPERDGYGDSVGSTVRKSLCRIERARRYGRHTMND